MSLIDDVRKRVPGAAARLLLGEPMACGECGREVPWTGSSSMLETVPHADAGGGLCRGHLILVFANAALTFKGVSR